MTLKNINGTNMEALPQLETSNLNKNEFSKISCQNDSDNYIISASSNSSSRGSSIQKLQICFTRSKLYNIFVLAREVKQPTTTTADVANVESTSVWWTLSEPFLVFASAIK